LSATQSFAVAVLASNQPPVLAAISDRTIHQGFTLLITNTATDADLPPNTLTFSLGTNAPTGAMIDPASGVLAWTPAESYVNTTNPIAVQVTDNGLPPRSDAKAFAVTVVARPVIQSADIASEHITISWSAIADQRYRLQRKDNLEDTNWDDLQPIITATGPTASKSDPIAAHVQRFYRVLLVP